MRTQRRSKGQGERKGEIEVERVRERGRRGNTHAGTMRTTVSAHINRATETYIQAAD